MTSIHIDPQTLPPWLRERVIEHHIYRQALSVARMTRDACTVAEQAAELQAIAAIGLAAASEAARDEQPSRTGAPASIAQTAALQSLAAACAATLLRLRARSLQGSGPASQSLLDTTSSLRSAALPQPAGGTAAQR
jgi:hypothetical protein